MLPQNVRNNRRCRREQRGCTASRVGRPDFLRHRTYPITPGDGPTHHHVRRSCSLLDLHLESHASKIEPWPLGPWPRQLDRKLDRNSTGTRQLFDRIALDKLLIARQSLTATRTDLDSYRQLYRIYSYSRSRQKPP